MFTGKAKQSRRVETQASKHTMSVKRKMGRKIGRLLACRRLVQEYNRLDLTCSLALSSARVANELSYSPGPWHTSLSRVPRLNLKIKEETTPRESNRSGKLLRPHLRTLSLSTTSRCGLVATDKTTALERNWSSESRSDQVSASIYFVLMYMSTHPPKS